MTGMNKKGRNPRVPSLCAVSDAIRADYQAVKYSTPASKIGWYLLPGTLTYRPLPERSE